jgi:hypothetical protein
MRRFVGALVALSFIVALDAQGTWTWNQLCSNNEWNAYCTGSICGTNPDRYWHYNNWGQSYCGSASGLGFPGPGSTVIFPATANALLASNVDIKTVTLNSGGQLTFAGGSLTLRDPANNNAPGVFTNAGLFRLPSTGSLRYWSGAIVNTGTLRHEANLVRWTGASLQNSGTVELHSGAWEHSSGTNTIQNTTTGKLLKLTSGDFVIWHPVQNAGLLDHREGGLSIHQLVQSGGETRTHRNRTLNLSTPMELQGGKLTGAGTLNATLNHTGGTLAPGIDDPNQPSLNPLGILTLNGNLTMGTNAALEIELSGTSNADPADPQYDQLIISGSNRSVQLNGTLRLKGRNGYVPNVGDTYDIVVRTGSWNPTGAFTTVVVDPATLPCVQVQVRYLTDRVRVEVTHAGERPDTNGDGCVDDADLLNVLFNFGLTGENPADVNCDLIVDDADLLAVLFAFGQGC